MRSRYSAYVLAAVDYLLATQAPETLESTRADLEVWVRRVRYIGLVVEGAERGGTADDEGVVRFCARFLEGGRLHTHRERSRFVRREGRWLYLDGAVEPVAPVVLGRNDACPCGSGQKFKRCHG